MRGFPAFTPDLYAAMLFKLAMLQSLAVWSLDSAIVASFAAFAPCSSLTLANDLRIRGKTKPILV